MLIELLEISMSMELDIPKGIRSLLLFITLKYELRIHERLPCQWQRFLHLMMATTMLKRAVKRLKREKQADEWFLCLEKK